VVALVLFWLLYALKPNTKAGIQKKHIGLLVICALTGIVINQILFVKGTALTNAIHASLLSLCTPIVIFCIGIFWYKQKVVGYKVIGLCLALLGAIVLIFYRVGFTNDGSTVLGDVLIIINACSYALYLVLAKSLMQHYKPIHVTRWIFLIGCCLIVPFGFNDFTQVQWQLFTPSHWWALGFVVMGATFLSYLIMVYGISKLGSETVGMYIYTQPVFATIASYVLFNHSLNLQKIMAAILIFIGLYLVNKNAKIPLEKLN
jgi:drug/metabolite transporter (DMT)-like permease